MSNSKKLLNQKSIGISNFFIIVWIIIALIGFIDAFYLTKVHYQGAEVTCSLTHKCDSVLTSEYATIAGLPISLGGVFYYLFMLFGAVLYLDRKKDAVIKFFSYFSLAGLITSAYFVYLQAFVLRAFCQYCLLSALTSSLLFVLGMFIIFKLRRTKKYNVNES